MTEIPSPGWYRVFQKVAMVVGGFSILLGFLIQNSTIWVVGLVVLVHALVATLIIAVEDRRKNGERN